VLKFKDVDNCGSLLIYWVPSRSANMISNFKPPQSRVLCRLADAKSVMLGIRANAEGISKP